MNGNYPFPDQQILENLRKGVVIPAHPLALKKNRELDEKRQKGLTRYYIESGAGGIAVGVHTTQFEIHNPEAGLYKPVLEISMEAVKEYGVENKLVKVAGICGKTSQAVKEAEIARSSGYDAGLLSLTELKEETENQIIEHAKEVARVIPLFGFYLQHSLGGRFLSFDFWCKFFEIENVIAVKIATFDRYTTIDVVRALLETEKEKEIALYTGNDDNIIFDLITPFKVKDREVNIVGGLLGHWAFWTKKSVEIFNEVKEIVNNKKPVPPHILTLAAEITDANGAIFDAKNNFAGCISGINEVLRRSGLLEGNWCLNPDEKLSPGQKEEIDRIYQMYPHLRDDEFVRENIERFLS